MDGRRATQKEVAQLAGVSQATVSLALSEPNSRSLPQGTLDRVRKAVKDLGYGPNRLAQGLKTRRTRTLACVVPDIANPYYPSLVHGVQVVADSEGHDVIAINTDVNEDRERRVLDWGLQGRVDGVIGVFFYIRSSELASLTQGALHVDHLRWQGEPALRLRRPDEPGAFWRQAWVNGVSFFNKNLSAAFRISQSVGEGIIIHGSRDWRDYEIRSDITVRLGQEGGVTVRVQGLRRYHAIVLARGGIVRLVKVRDDERTVLAEAPLPWRFEQPYAVAFSAKGTALTASLDGRRLFEVQDASFVSRGIGLLINEGALSTSEIRVHAA